MRVIALSGLRGSGKDTCANYLRDTFGYIPVSFAKSLKDQVAETYQISRDSLDHPILKETILLQYPVITTDAFTETLHHLLRDELKQGFWTPRALCILEGSAKRSVHSNYWVSQVTRKMQLDEKYVITDMRYRSEADTLRMLIPDVDFIRVINDRVQIVTTDPSERDLDGYKFDTHVYNNGTYQELYEALDFIMTKKLGERYK